MNQNTVISWVTTGIGLAGSAAVTKGWIDQNTATQVVGVAGTLVPLLWGLFIHRDSKVVQTASIVPGVETIRIAPTADPALQTLAGDQNVPTIQPAIPNYVPPTTSQRK